MTLLTISIGAFVIALTLGSAVVWGTPVFGLPIIAFVLLLLGPSSFAVEWCGREASTVTGQGTRRCSSPSGIRKG